MCIHKSTWKSRKGLVPGVKTVRAVLLCCSRSLRDSRR